MNRVTILDGGTGRELLRRGAPFGQPEWSARALLEGPHYVTQVHEAYVAAGADVITTNSYAVVPFHMGDERFASRGGELAALSGRLAREVADRSSRRVAVAGSLPPVCGSYRADWFDAHSARPVLETLVGSLRPFVDHWQAETLSSIAEAELVCQVLAGDQRHRWLSFTLADALTSKGSAQLRSGEGVGEAAAAALRLGAQAILFNCSQPEVMGSAVDEAIRAVRDQSAVAAPVEIGVYANAFPPQPEQAQANTGLSEIRADMGPADYLRWARGWVSQGANIIGGCCGIGPEHIAALGPLNAA